MGRSSLTARVSYLQSVAAARPLAALALGGIDDQPLFEELEIGTRSAAGPYPVSSDEIIQFALAVRCGAPPHRDEAGRRAQFLGG